jgi:hypothetical protein
VSTVAKKTQQAKAQDTGGTPTCSRCSGTGISARTRTYNPLTGRVAKIIEHACGACGGGRRK